MKINDTKMQYYSTMTLSDFVRQNWIELPREFVQMYEQHVDRFEALMYVDGDSYRNMYDETLNELETFVSEVDWIVEDAQRSDISRDTLLRDLHAVVRRHL